MDRTTRTSSWRSRSSEFWPTPTRVRLLLALDDAGDTAELPVNELAEAVGKRAGAVSQHLAKLRMARLVTTRRNGTQILYRIANEHVSQLVADALRHTEHLGPGVPAHHREPGAPQRAKMA